MAYTKNKSKKSVFKAFTGMAKSIQPDKGPSTQLRNEFYELEPAEVIDVILNDKHPSFKNYNDIGTIIARPCFSEYNKERKYLSKYKPLDMSIKDYPVVGEYVIVATYFTKKYYTQKINLNSNINNGMMPGKSIKLTDIPKLNYNTITSYKQSSASGTAKQSSGMFNNLFTKYPFVGRLDLAPIEQLPGEIVFNGRFGQSIKFGAPGKRQDQYKSPNMIFKVGQRLDDTSGYMTALTGKSGLKPIQEDVNIDGTSMFLTTNEEVPIQPATLGTKAHYKRLDKKKRPKKFDGKQIVLNSDRIIFNTKKNQFFCFSKLSQYFCTSDKFIVDTMKGINLNSEKDTVLSNKTKTIINSPKIYLGVIDEDKPKLKKGKLEHLVMGETLKKTLEDLIDTIMKTQWVNGAGPASLNPAHIPKYIGIKNKLNKILSKQNFTK